MREAGTRAGRPTYGPPFHWRQNGDAIIPQPVPKLRTNLETTSPRNEDHQAANPGPQTQIGE
jgi:hypothetical protein